MNSANIDMKSINTSGVFKIDGVGTKVTSTNTRAKSEGFRFWRVAQAIIGLVLPVISVYGVYALEPKFGAYSVGIGALAAWLMASPFLPITFWAVLTQNVRDEALPTMSTLPRAFALVFWLGYSPKSKIKTATWLNLVGLAIAAFVILQHGIFI